MAAWHIGDIVVERIEEFSSPGFPPSMQFPDFDSAIFDTWPELRSIDMTDKTSFFTHTLDSNGVGSFAGLYGGFTVVGTDLYFTGQDSISGYELRKFDTLTNTVLTLVVSRPLVVFRRQA